MELFNKALFLSQQKNFALTHWRVYTLMVNLFQILNKFVLLFRKNVIEKSSMIWRVLSLVKKTHIFQKHPVYHILKFVSRNIITFYSKLFSLTKHKSDKIYENEHSEL
jgi:hypothetical protein